MRDNKQFKERFQRWKNGEQVYKTGRPLPKYEDGKDGNILAYNPEEDYWTGPAATMPELNIIKKKNGKYYTSIGNQDNVYGNPDVKKKPYWVSPKGAGNMTVMPGDPEMIFFAPIAAGAGIAASPAITSTLGSAVGGINTVGDALAATAAGQRLTSGLNFAANAIGSNKVWPWINAGLTSAFGAHAIDKVRRGDIHNVGDVVDTGLDLMPLTQLAKPVINAVGRVGSAAETIANRTLLNTVQRNALGKPIVPNELFKASPYEGYNYFHGGLEPDFDFNTLDVFRLGSKQGKRGKDYAGFYMHNNRDKLHAFGYGQGEAHGIKVSDNAKVLKLNQNVERMPQSELKQYRDQGYDMITGSNVWGEPEYILLNKDVIEGTKFFYEPPKNELRLFKAPRSVLDKKSKSPTIEWADATRTPELYQIERYPGFMLKSLMKGNPLEKQLSKTGTISVNSIKAQAGKASEMEKSVIDNVLNSDAFAGQKAVDYNEFRKAVLDELITYTRKPQYKYNDYGIDRLGYRSDRHIWDMGHDPNIRIEDGLPVHADTGIPLSLEERAAWLNQGLPRLNTFAFESPKIPIGSDKHYDIGTLGHSRTYTTPDEPGVLHVMESQSDWGQIGFNARDYLPYDKLYYDTLVTHMSGGIAVDPKTGNVIDIEQLEKSAFDRLKMPQIKHLHDNYTSRQILENLRYAAENGLTKMRYPTLETAAKIEGFKKRNGTAVEMTPEQRLLYRELERIVFEEGATRPRLTRRNLDLADEIRRQQNIWDNEHPDWVESNRRYKEITDRIASNNGSNIFIYSDDATYAPEYQTILKKYEDFPKQFKKLWKDLEVRTVTDKKGNSWYEVDVPKDFLKREWIYGISPLAIGGGLAIPEMTK